MKFKKSRIAVLATCGLLVLPMACNSTHDSEKPKRPKMVEIAVIDDDDLLGVAYKVQDLLKQNGIDASIAGTVAYCVEVESKDVDKAIAIIRDSPELKSKGIKIESFDGNPK